MNCVFWDVRQSSIVLATFVATADVGMNALLSNMYLSMFFKYATDAACELIVVLRFGYRNFVTAV